MNLAADMDSQTYPTVPWLHQHLAGTAIRKGEQGQTSHVHQHGPCPSAKPFLMNEYAHARGNALGNFQAYGELMRAHPRLIGGVIWNWCDLNLARSEGGRLVAARGGDFGDTPNDGDFCECGLVDAWRRPHPHLAPRQEAGRRKRHRSHERGLQAVSAGVRFRDDFGGPAR
jgi:beta-galactosidase